MKTFIICEKPSAAAKIAAALADKKIAKKELNGAPYYEFERDGKQILVSSALGHLFTLKNLRPMKEYPVYDIDWMPTYKVDKKAARTKPFVDAIQELSKGADEFISATDYDTEGAVIGYNVLKFLCGEDSIKRAKRMKFSALTPQDLRQAYDSLLPKLDFELIDSGIARHVLDWYWGMNLSVHSDEDLILREDGIVKIVKIGEFVDQFFGKGEGEITVPSKFEALCFSPSGKLKFNPIKAVVRHTSPEGMVKVTLQGGREISVTKSHSLFVLKRGKIETVPASSLKVGDYIVAPKKIPSGHSLGYITLERWGKEKNLCINEKVVRLNSARGEQGREGSKPSWELPVRLPITPELMRLLGYFCSEGSYGTEIFISNSNPRIVEDIIRCASRVFISDAINSKRKITVHVDKRDGSKDIIFGGKISVMAFQDVFQIPAGAENKRIPWIVFNVPYELQLEFLKGLFAGDGSLSYNQTTGECALYLSTKSKRLASELAYLLTQIGATSSIIPCKGGRFFHVSIASRASLRKLLDLVPANYREKVVGHVNTGRESPKIVIPLQESALGGVLESIGIHHETRWKKGVGSEYFKSLLTKLSKKGINTERFLPFVNDLIFPRITKIEEITPSRYVYDISVEEHENFVCGFGGICAHNSRAMSAAVESARQRFAKLSAGRVKTPTLRILVEREREIKAFKPEPFWVISLIFELDDQEIVAEHATPRFFDKGEAEKVRDACEGKKAKVSAIQTRRYQQHPPIPFDLGTLQAEAYRCFGYTPMRTQQIAQQLYDAAYISYPRTSNQKFPPTIDLAAILKRLRGISTYKKLVDKLLDQPVLAPTEGTKTDPAHPPIHPTGEKPKRLVGVQQRLYDLIVRRFLSIFCRPAVKESIKVELDVNGQRFYLRGHNILEESWLEYYAPYIYRDDVGLPKLSKGQELVPKELCFEGKETQPPPRYNPASIVKVMEEKNLGTKCLCGNVSILTSNFQTLSIQELYENLYSRDKNGILSVTSLPPRKSLEQIGTRALFGSVSEMSTESHVTCMAFNPVTLDVIKKFAMPSKRETKPWEEVHSIKTKYGFIEVTSDHPIFVVYDNKITCKRADEIKIGDKLLSYIPRNQIEGKEIELRDRTFIYGVSEKFGRRIAAKRKEHGLSQREFAKLFGVSQTTIHAYESGSKVPISVLTKLDIDPKFICGRSTSGVIPNPFPIYMSSWLARLFGRLTGDGSFGTAKFRSENSCDFRYCNTEYSMIQSFIQDVMMIFNTQPKVISTDRERKKRFYQAKLPGIVGRILFDIAPEIVAHDVPKIVLDDKRFWPDYLSAIFDDEATVPTKELKLRFTQKSKKLISQIVFMLNEFGIKTSRLSFENGSWKFGIYGRRNIEKFLQRVGLTHPTKLQRLLKSARKRSSIRKKAMIYYLLAKGLKPVDIAREMKCSVVLVQGYLRELLLDGLIENLRKFLGRGRGSESIYVVKVPFGVTFYSLLDAEILTHQLSCKPVCAIQQKKLPEFVYDLSVDKESPAFVAGDDNIIVHNSTRAPILQTLYERGYIFGNQIVVTDIGMEVVDSLSKNCPEIVSEELTAHFESEMEKIQEGKTSKDNVIAEAREKLDEILGKFKERQEDIGKDLGDAYAETKRKQRVLGTCAKCGGELRVIVSRATHKRFAGCSNYPNCKNAFPLPQAGFIVSLNKKCEHCGAPMIQVNRAGMRPYHMCLEPKCESKKDWGKQCLQKKKTES